MRISQPNLAVMVSHSKSLSFWQASGHSSISVHWVVS